MAARLVYVFAALAAAMPTTTPTHQNFTTSCSTIQLLPADSSDQDDDLLKASCGSNGKASAGNTRDSALDLNLCLGIDHTSGQLAWSVYGKYSLYCGSCLLSTPAVLTCLCKPLDREVAASTTSIDLDGGIGNENGFLACMGGKGS